MGKKQSKSQDGQVKIVITSEKSQEVDYASDSDRESREKKEFGIMQRGATKRMQVIVILHP